MALRVLLADDEKEFVETLAERLDLRGIEVRVALDGKAALTTLDEMAAAEALPDVMVVDLLMPGMTGTPSSSRCARSTPACRSSCSRGMTPWTIPATAPWPVPSPA